MQLKPDYLKHEIEYASLKEAGYQGWGGEAYARRKEGWEIALQSLLSEEGFPGPGASILEVGCGTGVASLLLAEAGYRVTGIDISSTAVEWARERAAKMREATRATSRATTPAGTQAGTQAVTQTAPAVTPALTHSATQELVADFYVGSVTDMSIFESGIFDVVFDGNCFHCIIGEDRASFLNEVRRLLKPTGVFFVSTMIGDPKTDLANGYFDPVSRCQIVNGKPYRHMGTCEQVLGELADTGFSIMSWNVNSNPWWDHLTCLAVRG